MFLILDPDSISHFVQKYSSLSICRISFCFLELNPAIIHLVSGLTIIGISPTLFFSAFDFQSVVDSLLMKFVLEYLFSE